MRLGRREALEKAMALGALGVSASVAPSALLAAWVEQERRPRAATPGVELGPFYKRGAPSTRALRPAGDPGLALTVSGSVWSARGEALPGAMVDVWHSDHLGHYDLDGYRYRARLAADEAGKYGCDTVMPGHYPGRVCQHIHYLVTAAGHKPLVTQLYFATDRVFEGDPERNFGRDPLITSRELVRPVVLTGDPREVRAQVEFELVLEPL